MLPCLRCTHLGKGRRWLAILIMTMTNISVGLTIAWPLSALPKIKSGEAGLKLDVMEQSWIASILFFGNLMSPIPCGYLVDWAGRHMILATFIWLQVLSLALILTGVFWVLVLSRLLSGIWIGINGLTIPMFIGESIEPNLRGQACALFSAFFFLGAFVQTLFGKFLSYFALNLTSFGFSIFLGVLITILPESPYYLVSRKLYTKAEASLIWFRGSCPPELIPSIESTISNKPSHKELFLKKNFKALITVNSLIFIQRSSGITLLISFATIAFPNCFVNAKLSAVILSAIWLVATTLSAAVMDRYPRRILLIISCSGSCLSMLCITVWFLLRDQIGIDVSGVLWLPLICSIIHGIFFCFGLSTVPVIVLGELYPLNIKGNASAISIITAALTSFLVAKLFFPIKLSVGLFLNFLLATISCFTGILLAKFLLIETKGKTLEEIQQMLSIKEADG